MLLIIQRSQEKVSLFSCKAILMYVIYILTEVTFLGGSLPSPVYEFVKITSSTIEEIIDSAKCWLHGFRF